MFQAVKLRLSYQIPYINRWNEAMLLGVSPQHLQETMESLWTLVDDIWYASGDRSVDMNYYTKRSILLTIYTSTELFMLTDRSENFEETWMFLQRRFKDHQEFHHSINNLSTTLQGTGVAIQSLLSAYQFNFKNDIPNLQKIISQETQEPQMSQETSQDDKNKISQKEQDGQSLKNEKEIDKGELNEEKKQTNNQQ